MDMTRRFKILSKNRQGVNSSSLNSARHNESYNQKKKNSLQSILLTLLKRGVHVDYTMAAEAFVRILLIANR